MILWIISLTSATVISLFWQPNMTSDYTPEPPRRPSQKEKYISMVWDLIHAGNYAKLEKVLERPKYVLSDLPVESWKELILRNKGKILDDGKKIPVIERLENLLS